MKQSKNISNIDNTGFGANSNVEGKRLTNKDGSVNLEKIGMPFWKRISLYHTLLRMNRWKFLACIFMFYTSTNVLFAVIYILNGVENLQGVHVANDLLTNFQQAFFFSSQTLTTVGYGHISPVGLGANVIASLESFIGILAFALVTGLLYGRFTRPRAYLIFSDHALIAPYKEGTGLMFRLCSYKNNHLTDAEAEVTLAWHVDDNGKRLTRFYVLKLEISKINSMALSWTIVHKIDEHSPLYNMSLDDLKKANAEVLVFVKAFDDHFSNKVQQRTSYEINEIIYGGRFLPMFRRAEDGTTTILELDKIGAYEPVTLPETQNLAINV